MRLLSIQVGQPERFDSENGAWQTAIFKRPVPRGIVRRLGLEGDAVADRRHHGGLHQAVLMYCGDHYARWQAEWGGEQLPGGAFGENLTVSGLDESSVCLGDRFRIDDVHLEVSKPRTPCNTLAWRHGRADLIALVERTHRSGWYLRVLAEGAVEPGAPIELQERPYPEFPVAWVADVMKHRHGRADESARLAACPALCPEWRERFRNSAAVP